MDTLVEPAPALDEEVGSPELWAIVLAGGIGSRFWPLSTADRPKQLLALVTERPLITETVARLAPLIPPERVLVVTSRDIAAKIHGAIRDVPADNLLVEPRPLGTAAALAWGASEVMRRGGADVVCCAIHADLAVDMPDILRAVLRSAGRLASDTDALVAIGARPTRPEPAFGYIRPGAPLVPGPGHDRGEVYWASGFVEKPDPSEAQRLIADGALWHTGILLARSGAVLDALAEHTPEVALGLDDLAAGDVERFAWSIRSTSIERGLLERSDRVIVIVTPAEFGWDDVGTWACLRRTRELDDQGNGARGPAYFVDASANVVHTEAGTVVLYGVSQLLVVALPGLIFVTTLERAEDLRPLLDALPGSMRMGKYVR